MKTLVLTTFIFLICQMLYSQKFDLEKTFNRTLTDQERKDIKTSIYDYSQAIKINPDDPYNYINRGVCYANLGLHPDAISDYNRALKIDSEIAEAYYNRGIARARFRFTKTACLDIKESYKLGLQVAKKTYDNNCGVFKGQIGEITD
jgi:tetratricopeptide (TPR) repeat protein